MYGGTVAMGKKCKGKKGRDMQIGEATKRMKEGIARRQK